MVIHRLLLLLLAAGVAAAADPVHERLERAYAAVRAYDYEYAVESFRAVLADSPTHLAAHKDIAYTYLKIGETELARDHFAEAMRLQPDDEHVALEYAFLCYETKQQATARRIFDGIRRNGNQIAEQAFQNIDRELLEGIERWSRAIELSPESHSAHVELARLAERRDDLALAAKHLHRAWQLRPDVRAVLLDLGRVLQLQGRKEEAHAALLAASRGAEPRTAEAAKELLPARYPYVYEFEAALELDTGNVALRRELAYLHLQMGNAAQAEDGFRRIVDREPADALSSAQLGFLLLGRKQVEEARPLLERALQSADDELGDRIRSALGLPQTLRKRDEVPRSATSHEAQHLAERSLEAGYLEDALKYLRIAHENDPIDFGLMLKMGWTYNTLKDDKQAVEWFGLARKSPDPQVASEARRAYGNLKPQFARFRTSMWLFPMYSSRWKDLFAYAQFKTELMPSWPVHVYLSTRFSGDTRRTLSPDTRGLASPQYLSESSGIFALGASTKPWRGIVAWAESGVAASYLQRPDASRTSWDHRAGVSAVRSFGRNLGATSRGLFVETSADAVYISRFDQDTIAYLRSRTGYTIGKSETVRLQFCWNLNGTSDTRRYQWANAIETGPGVRIKWNVLPQPLLFTMDALEGRHTVLDGTRPPGYSDIRIGLWYAVTR